MKKKKLAITLILLAVVIAAIAIGISISGDENAQNTEVANGGNQGEVSFEVTAPPNETNSTENTEETENGSG